MNDQPIQWNKNPLHVGATRTSAINIIIFRLQMNIYAEMEKIKTT